jgi:hypothetical protein
VVNGDKDTQGLLRLAFIPDYRVSVMEVIAPGTDLSEQISTAGKEASGTGNMKFMMNGAVTIGTLDGANIEIRDQAGADNFFLFGMTAAAVEARRDRYDPQAIIHGHGELREVMSPAGVGSLQPVRTGLFDPIIQAIRSPQDPWMTAADFPPYIQAQAAAAAAYRDPEHWTAHGHPQHRPQRPLLLRPHHRRIQPRHLEAAERWHPWACEPAAARTSPVAFDPPSRLGCKKLPDRPQQGRRDSRPEPRAMRRTAAPSEAFKLVSLPHQPRISPRCWPPPCAALLHAGPPPPRPSTSGT